MFGIPELQAAIKENTKVASSLLAALKGASLTEILNTVRLLKAQGVLAMASLADLKAAVEANGVVVQSAIVLIEGIAAQLNAAIEANDPAKVQEVLDSLNAEKQALADAVAANTPNA